MIRISKLIEGMVSVTGRNTMKMYTKLGNVITCAIACNFPPTSTAFVSNYHRNTETSISKATFLTRPTNTLIRTNACSISHFSSPLDINNNSLLKKNTHCCTKSTVSCQTRLYSSLFPNNNNNRDDDDDDNVLSKMAKAGSRLRPKNWFKSDSEIEAADQKKKRSDEVKSGISALLKDAPLGVQMIGKLVAPLMSGLAEQMAEQAKSMNELADEARIMLSFNSRAKNILGDNIFVDAPFSQGSSSMMVDGRQTTQIQASFSVSGSIQSGICNMIASGQDGETKIDKLVLNVGGQVFEIDPSGKTSSTGPGPSFSVTGSVGNNSGSGKNNIIDAEFVDKK